MHYRSWHLRINTLKYVLSSKGIQELCIWTILFNYTNIDIKPSELSALDEQVNLRYGQFGHNRVISSHEGTWSFYGFPLVVSHAISITYFHLWCMLEGSVWIWRKSDLFCEVHWGAKLNLAPLSMPKWVWTSMNGSRMFFVHTSTVPPTTMHYKLIEDETKMLYATPPKVILSQRTTLIFGNV